MEHYVGIDVSLEHSSVCVVDGTGKIVVEAKVVSEPEALIAWLRRQPSKLARIGLEAGGGPARHAGQGHELPALAPSRSGYGLEGGAPTRFRAGPTITLLGTWSRRRDAGSAQAAYSGAASPTTARP